MSTSPSGASTAQPPSASEAAQARLWLAAGAIGPVVVFCGAGIVNTFVGDGTVPREVLPVLVVPSMVALVQARRHRESIIANLDIRGLFSTMAWAFGVICLLGFAITLPAWDSPLWVAGAVSGAMTLRLVRRPRK